MSQRSRVGGGCLCGSGWSRGRVRGPRAAQELRRAADEPSFARSCDLLAGRPQGPPGDRCGWLPLAPRLVQQRDLRAGEVNEVCRQQVMLAAAESVQGPPRAVWLDRGGESVRTQLRRASRKFSALTGVGRVIAHLRRRPSRTAFAAEARRRWCDAAGCACRRLAEMVAWRGRHKNPAGVGRCCCNHPRMPPLAAASALYRSVLMPGCPTRGRRSQTSTRSTLLRSDPNTRASERCAFGVRWSGFDRELRTRLRRRGSSDRVATVRTVRRATRGRR